MARARRRREERHENHERWLVSYADFITLLFAFFVVMYSISSVNDGKYRVLTDTLTEAFTTPAKTMDPIQVGETPRQIVSSGEGQVATSVSSAEEIAPEEAQEELPVKRFQTLNETEAELKQALGSFIGRGLVNVTQTDRGIEVEMKSKMLFQSGSARLSGEALSALRGVSKILSPLANRVNVEGHTDNVPIQTLAFPSNWELSAARAASVVNLFARLGVKADRLAATGYGEFQPISENETEEGRQRNRRVALIIMATEHDREIRAIGTPLPKDAP